MELEFSKLKFQMELEFSKLKFQLGNTLFELESTKLVF